MLSLEPIHTLAYDFLKKPTIVAVQLIAAHVVYRDAVLVTRRLTMCQAVRHINRISICPDEVKRLQQIVGTYPENGAI
ncbi:hypothetical protein DPMN_144206 [Dreissena polymorpha]|uniref:Uncharacterized protein n=1 Tax=Dreissena polymorpha TaxID=45954 RepID=A0A9D4JKR3_DREPO|nr:hypothetical protein DPMN_144206 [Dreissena polymorpha]